MTLTTFFRRIAAAIRDSGQTVSLNLPPPPPGGSGGFKRPPPGPEGEHGNNVAGDFWVEAGCCTQCGVTWDIAPDLFGYDDSGCWVKRQPATVEEQDRMLQVLSVQEMGCIHYRGCDPRFLRAISGD